MTATQERIARKVEAQHEVNVLTRAMIQSASYGAGSVEVSATKFAELEKAMRALVRAEMAIADQTNGTLMRWMK